MLHQCAGNTYKYSSTVNIFHVGSSESSPSLSRFENFDKISDREFLGVLLSRDSHTLSVRTCHLSCHQYYSTHALIRPRGFIRNVFTRQNPLERHKNGNKL